MVKMSRNQLFAIPELDGQTFQRTHLISLGSRFAWLIGFQNFDSGWSFLSWLYFKGNFIVLFDCEGN